MLTMTREESLSVFTDWLKDEMDKRQWRATDLAEKAGVTEATLSRILGRGDRSPGPDLCRKIAGALDIPPEKVFRVAGLLPEKENVEGMSRFEEEFLGWFRQLPKSRQEAVLEIVKGMVISRARQT